jgi:hypothetical protein
LHLPRSFGFELASRPAETYGVQEQDMSKLSRASSGLDFGSDELGTMARVLEGRHGCLAAEVAEFFSSTHLQSEDRRRGVAWARVADIVRERTARRLADQIHLATD